MAVIDSHQHFWDPAVTEFSWMTETHEPIRRRFAPDDLRPFWPLTTWMRPF
jgi:L-fuconolactonase